jgi:mRNA-degrading endonuclease toxin of MazEF toxin-antitoxin module
MPSFDRGDVVIVDLGMAAKVRPCVVISVSQLGL